MEIAIPLVALASLYVVSNQSKKPVKTLENFALPNTNIPDKNYPSQYPVSHEEIDLTSSLSVNNAYSGQSAYTDKYFNPNKNREMAKQQHSGNADYYSLTGDKVSSQYFEHNNMVPYFGSKIRPLNIDANTTESVLDNMMGGGSQAISKKEQAPMFSPGENLTYAFGAPNTTDFYRSRMNVSANMANVKPFADQKVGPGLGLGYTTEGAGGFNSGMMDRDAWNEKTVDQLRIANNPKPSGYMLFGHEGPAASHIQNLGSIGTVEKNRPDTVFEMGSERYLTTTGLEKGQTLRAIPVERYVSRPETSMSYTGGAGSDNNATYIPGEYAPSTNIHLGAVPLAGANAGGRNYATDADYGVKSQMAYPNNRTSNQQDSGYFGAVGGAFGAVVAPLLDMLRPSRKENTIGTLRPYQNPGSTVPESYIFNPADRPAPTIREMTEKSKNHLNINANQRGGAYAVTAQQTAYTNRHTTSDYYYAGNASAGARSRQARPYDAEYNQRNNDLKSAAIMGTGYTPSGGMSLLNSSINMKQASKDNVLKNTRALGPSMPYQSPGVEQMGQMNGQNGLYQNIHLDRTDSDNLTALKGNPYALSIVGGI